MFEELGLDSPVSFVFLIVYLIGNISFARGLLIRNAWLALFGMVCLLFGFSTVDSNWDTLLALLVTAVLLLASVVLNIFELRIAEYLHNAKQAKKREYYEQSHP